MSSGTENNADIAEKTSVRVEGESLNCCLQGDIGIAVIAEIYQQLKGALSQEVSEITIETAQAKSYDTSALQLFVALFLHSQSRNMKFGWKGRSDKLDKKAQGLGLARHPVFVDA